NPGDDVVHDDATGAARIDAVNEVRAGAHGDVVDHVADDLNAGLAVAAAISEDAGIAAGAWQVVDAVADHLVVIAVDADAFGAVAGDIEVDDLDIVAAVPNGVAPRAINLRAPFRIRDVGDRRGGAAAFLPLARRRDRRRADREPRHQAGRGDRGDYAVARRPRHGATSGQAIRVLEGGRELHGRPDLSARRRRAHGHGGHRRRRRRS